MILSWLLTSFLTDLKCARATQVAMYLHGLMIFHEKASIFLASSINKVLLNFFWSTKIFKKYHSYSSLLDTCLVAAAMVGHLFDRSRKVQIVVRLFS